MSSIVKSYQNILYYYSTLSFEPPPHLSPLSRLLLYTVLYANCVITLDEKFSRFM